MLRIPLLSLAHKRSGVQGTRRQGVTALARGAIHCAPTNHPEGYCWRIQRATASPQPSPLRGEGAEGETPALPKSRRDFASSIRKDGEPESLCSYIQESPKCSEIRVQKQHAPTV